MVTPKHILGTFDEALASLRNNVLMMAGLTERSLDPANGGRSRSVAWLFEFDVYCATSRTRRRSRHQHCRRCRLRGGGGRYQTSAVRSIGLRRDCGACRKTREGFRECE